MLGSLLLVERKTRKWGGGSKEREQKEKREVKKQEMKIQKGRRGSEEKKKKIEVAKTTSELTDFKFCAG